MTVRERMEQEEYLTLSPLAQKAAETKGRPEPEEPVFAKALQELSAGSMVPETTGTELRGVRVR